MPSLVVDDAFIRRGACPLYRRPGSRSEPDPAYIVLQPGEGTITPMTDSVEGGHPFLQRDGVRIFSVPPNIARHSLEELLRIDGTFLPLCAELCLDKEDAELDDISGNAQALIDQTAETMDVYSPRLRLQGIATWAHDAGEIVGLNLHSVPGCGSVLMINGATSDQVILDTEKQVTYLLEPHETFEERPAEWFTNIRNFFKFKPRAAMSDVVDL